MQKQRKRTGQKGSERRKRGEKREDWRKEISCMNITVNKPYKHSESQSEGRVT